MSRPGRIGIAALLSQALVAYTIEFDNEFELRMLRAGYPGRCLSLVIWANLLRFLPPAGVSVGELAKASLAPAERVKHQLGCLERWEIVTIQPGRRDGFGSGRGIRSDWIIRLTPAGVAAVDAWSGLLAEIDGRWESRFGREAIDRLRNAFHSVVEDSNLRLPLGLPIGGADFRITAFPPRGVNDVQTLGLASLMSQALLLFEMEFDAESPAPLALCANSLRVLGVEPIAESDLPRRTGVSPEMAGIGWQLKQYITVSSAGRRGKWVSLSPIGLKAQRTYYRLIEDIEQRWEKKFGKSVMRNARSALEALFAKDAAGVCRISKGLVPPPGVARSATLSPALGRSDIGPAARQRIRDRAEQTESFLSDPAKFLPHFPLWDMNRGFGP